MNNTSELVMTTVVDDHHRHEDNEQRDNVNDDSQQQNDWKLAAYVIDRIFLITFSVLFVGGTASFLGIFALAHYHF